MGLAVSVFCFHRESPGASTIYRDYLISMPDLEADIYKGVLSESLEGIAGHFDRSTGA